MIIKIMLMMTPMIGLLAWGGAFKEVVAYMMVKLHPLGGVFIRLFS